MDFLLKAFNKLPVGLYQCLFRLDLGEFGTEMVPDAREAAAHAAVVSVVQAFWGTSPTRTIVEERKVEHELGPASGRARYQLAAMTR